MFCNVVGFFSSTSEYVYLLNFLYGFRYLIYILIDRTEKVVQERFFRMTLHRKVNKGYKKDSSTQTACKKLIGILQVYLLQCWKKATSSEEQQIFRYVTLIMINKKLVSNR
jgi:hypothetical protein